jgi:hypothetical protein
VAAGDQELGY